MGSPERKYFEELKQELSAVFRQEHPGAPVKIEEWNVKTIGQFQSSLQRRVKSSISTKWFYTHIKSDAGGKLPRTDVLNLLTQYCGYGNWEEFYMLKKNEEEKSVLPEEEQREENAHPLSKQEMVEQKLMETATDNREELKNEGPHIPSFPGQKSSVAGIFLGCGLIIMLLVSWIILRKEEKVSCRFCFTDANFGIPVRAGKIEVQLLEEMQSPVVFSADSSACISIEHRPGKVRFVVKAEYCLPDTITRIFGQESTTETIPLRTDDYALMIHIFSSSNVGDWEKRKEQLNKMFDDNAEIYQLYPGDARGMEMYNKEEFINKMTMPLQSMKNIRVLKTEYKERKIILLRFTINE